eukprot:4551619-Karenia_brevis.AAC.1
MKQLGEFEENQNEDDANPASKKRKKEVTDIETTIKNRELAETKFSKNLGVFWPDYVMKLHNVDYQDDDLQVKEIE